MNNKHLSNIFSTKTNSLAISACFLWSTAFVAVKTGLKYSEPFYFAGIRFMLSGLVLIPFCGNFFTYIEVIRKNIRTIILLAILQTFILYGIFFYAMTFTPAALVAIIIGSSPLITAIASHFIMHDDRMTPARTLSLLSGIVGVIILSISRKPWTGPGLKEFIGIILLLVGSTSSALGNILVAKNSKINPLILNSSQIFLGGFFLFLLSLGLEGVQEPVKAMEFYGALIWLVFISAVGFSIWFTLLSRPGIKVSELNIWKFIIPISGAILSWSLLPEESPDIVSIFGMLIITTSVVLFNCFSSKMKK